MDQHRDTPGTDGWREVISRRHMERAALQNHLDQLHKTINRLNALRLEYQELTDYVQKNKQNAYLLKRDMNTVAIQLGLSPIPSQDLESGKTEKANEPQVPLLT